MDVLVKVKPKQICGFHVDPSAGWFRHWLGWAEVYRLYNDDADPHKRYLVEVDYNETVRVLW